MKNSIRDFFYFNKGDRRAVVALGCIVVFCLGVLIVLDAIEGRERGALNGEKEMDSTYRAASASDCNVQRNNGLALKQIDPNSVDSATLVLIGIKPWKVRTFLHYREAGKVFYSLDDIGDTYGWTAEDIEMLAPYVQISEDILARKQRLRTNTRQVVQNVSSSNKEYASGRVVAMSGDVRTELGDKDVTAVSGDVRKELRNKDVAAGGMESVAKYSSNKFRTLTKVDANVADSATLCRIPGIGGGISKAIIRYRTRLGGFCSTQQLLEISIFSPELLEWFTISDTSGLTKLPINEASFQSLNSHPYITYEQTRNLLRYIRLYGRIENEQTLISTGIFTPKEIEKLRPYIRY